MKKIFSPLVIVFICSVASYSQVSKSILKQIQAIDSNIIKSHVAYLADDKLKGRLPGTEGFQMAVDYVAGKFKDFGFLPAGENGTYLQPLILRKTKIIKDKANIQLKLANGKTRNLVIGEDLALYPNAENQSVTINAPLVFVGAGFQSSTLGFNDYNNIDVKGKIVVIVRKIPENVAENVKRHMMYPSTYQNVALKNGAIGVLICNYAQNMVQFKSGANAFIANGQTVSVKPNNKVEETKPKVKLYGSISVAVLKELMNAEGGNFDDTWKRLEKGEYVSSPMKASISGTYESVFSDIESYNVIAKLEGSDKKLKSEYVVHSGHLDHLGVGKPVNGDSIYNGAHDNASGTASLLEIARMYSTISPKPKRSILFVIVTAEEMGLLGSAYFNEFPTVPKGKIVADINTDMPTIIAPLESVAPLGAEHSSMWGTVEKASKLLGLKIETDPDPAEGRFVRSDQYNFFVAGIPAIHIKYGYKYSSPAYDLAAKVKIFRENNYHKQSDNFNNSFVWSAGRKYAQVNFLVSYLIAQNKKRPTWNKNDFFNPANN